MISATDLRQKSIEELLGDLDDAKEEHFALRFQESIGQLEDLNRMRITRRNIARINTVIREKQLEAEE